VQSLEVIQGWYKSLRTDFESPDPTDTGPYVRSEKKKCVIKLC